MFTQGRSVSGASEDSWESVAELSLLLGASRAQRLCEQGIAPSIQQRVRLPADWPGMGLRPALSLSQERQWRGAPEPSVHTLESIAQARALGAWCWGWQTHPQAKQVLGALWKACVRVGHVPAAQVVLPLLAPLWSMQEAEDAFDELWRRPVRLPHPQASAQWGGWPHTLGLWDVWQAVLGESAYRCPAIWHRPVPGPFVHADQAHGRYKDSYRWDASGFEAWKRWGVAPLPLRGMLWLTGWAPGKAAWDGWLQDTYDPAQGTEQQARERQGQAAWDALVACEPPPPDLEAVVDALWESWWHAPRGWHAPRANVPYEQEAWQEIQVGWVRRFSALGRPAPAIWRRQIVGAPALARIALAALEALPWCVEDGGDAAGWEQDLQLNCAPAVRQDLLEFGQREQRVRWLVQRAQAQQLQQDLPLGQAEPRNRF